MGHGGARPGSGRKKGAANRFNEKARRAATAGGITPLEYMLNILRDENQQPETRMDAAKAAAPYVHAKLASVEHKGDADAPLRFVVEVPTEVLDTASWAKKYGGA